MKKGVIVLGFLLLLCGCTGDKSSEQIASVKSTYEQVIQESEVSNEGKGLDDGLIDQSHAYINLNLEIKTLANEIEKSPDADYSERLRSLCGVTPNDNAQAAEWMGELLDFIVEEDRDYLSAFARRMEKCESITKGIFEDQYISFEVSKISPLLKELHLSPDSFGRVLAMTDIYGSQITFNDSGFTFIWDGKGGSFELKLIEDPQVFIDFVNRYNEVITQEQTQSEAIKNADFIQIDDVRLTDENDRIYVIDFRDDDISSAYMDVYLNDEKTKIIKVEYMLDASDSLKSESFSSVIQLMENILRSTASMRALVYATQPSLSVEQAGQYVDSSDNVQNVLDQSFSISPYKYQLKTENGPVFSCTIEMENAVS